MADTSEQASKAKNEADRALWLGLFTAALHGSAALRNSTSADEIVTNAVEIADEAFERLKPGGKKKTSRVGVWAV